VRNSEVLLIGINRTPMRTERQSELRVDHSVDWSRPSALASAQNRRLLQTGIALLLFTSFEGFAIPYLGAPRLALSAHTLGALQAVLLIGLGLLWPKLNLGTTSLRIAFWLLIYSALAILAAYVLGSFWGAGTETMPLAAGSTHGSALEETAIKIVAYSSAPAGIVSFALVLWGLRRPRSGMESGRI
jgi:hydroxylaminobenzene mutase